MKKIFTLLLSSLLTSSLVFSQDLIMKKNGDEIKTKVEEITSSEIKYKKFDNLEGPTYSIQKSEVFIIKYANGTKEVMGESSSNPTPAPSPTYAAAAEEQPKGSSKIDIDGGKYYQFNRRLSDGSLFRIINESKKQDAIKEIKTSKTLGQIGKPFIVAGIPFMAVGVAAIAIGALIISANDDYYGSSSSYSSLYSTGASILSVGVTAGAVGVASLTTGIVLTSIGKGRIKKAVALYNAGL